MPKPKSLIAYAAGVFFALGVAPSWGQGFASGNGLDDAGCGSLTDPCRQINAAIAATPETGVVHVLAGTYDAIRVEKAVDIIAESSSVSVLTGGTTCPGNQATVFAAICIEAPPNAVIRLHGFTVDNGNFLAPHVSFLSGATLHLEKMIFTESNNFGIRFTPSSGASELYISDSVMSDNRNSTSAGGILIKPISSASVRVQIERTLVENNTNGIIADARGGTGGIRGVVRDTVVAGNTTYGVLAQSAGATVNLLLSNVTIQSNQVGLAAVGASGAPALYVDHSQITGNGTGLAASGVGKIFSYGNNNLGPNAANGAFSGVIAVK